MHVAAMCVLNVDTCLSMRLALLAMLHSKSGSLKPDSELQLAVLLHSAFQMISPTKKPHLACSTTALNPRLQPVLNPPSSKKSELQLRNTGPVWRVGDRVMHTKNDVKRDVMNGDLGVIHSVNDLETKVKVAYPPRRSSKGKQHLVEYEGQELGKELQHAWAITVHKVRWCGRYFVVTWLNIYCWLWCSC
jgi:ATP-dependent exoDNAse (exonuclease V) alpha subunit